MKKIDIFSIGSGLLKRDAVFGWNIGGARRYIETLLDYCKKNGIDARLRCSDNLPPTGRLLKWLVRSSAVFSRSFETYLQTLNLRFLFPRSFDLYGEVICMDAVCSAAFSGNILVVHGKLTEEVKRRVGWNVFTERVLRLEREGYLSAHRVIAVDEALVDHIDKVSGVKAEYIPNPIDQEHFRILERQYARKLLNLPLDRRIVLFVGGSTEKYIEQISSWRKSLEKLGFITLHATNVPYSEMPVYYNAADIMVSMSKVQGLIRAVMESMACGTPAISNGSPLAFHADIETLVSEVENFDLDIDRMGLRSKVIPYSAENIIKSIIG